MNQAPRLTCLVVMVLLLAQPAAGERPALLPVPEPALDRLGALDREHADALRSRLDQTLTRWLAAPDDAPGDAPGDGEPTDEDLARSFGDLGALYILYEFFDASSACLTNARRLDSRSFRWAYYLGVVRGYEGALEEAERHFVDASRMRPEDVAVWVRLGRARADLGDAEGAAAAFERILALNEAVPAAHHGLGLLAIEAGDADRAIAHLDRALELQPTATVIHHGLGMAWRLKGDVARAREHLRANQHDPVAFVDPLIAELQQQLLSPRTLIRAGTNAEASGDAERARALFEEAVARLPDDAVSRYNLARALVDAGEPDAAIEQFKAVIELQPTYRDAHVNLAFVLVAENRLAEAEKHFARAVEIDSLDFDSRHSWAVALARLGRTDEARQVLESLLTEPGLGDRLFASAHRDLSRLALRRGDNEQASRHLEATVEKAPDDVESRQTLAQLLGRAGRFADAADQLVAIVERQPDNVDARFGAALTLLLADRATAARAVLESGLARSPNSVPLRHILARLLATATDPAVRDGDRALRLAREVFSETGNPDHAQTVAMALAEIGEWSAAVSLQEQILDQVRASGQVDGLARIEQRLARYRAQQPVRDPWTSGS